jgi:putative phage-type endonuclease
VSVYTVLEVEQGSDAWKQARFEKFTASQTAALYNLDPYRTLLQIAEEKRDRREPPVDPSKQQVFAMGHEAERAGREFLKRNYGLNLEPAVLVSSLVQDLLASLDGFNPDRGLIFEAKYMGREKFAKVKHGEIPPHHAYQVQAQLLTSGAKKCLYFAMDPEGSAEAIELRPDFEMQKDIGERVTAFMENLRKGILPEPCDRDVIQITDARFAELAILHRQIKSMEAQYSELESSLLSQYSEHARFQAGDVLVTKYWAKGNVDYSKIPQLKGVDLERFRKAGSMRTKVTFKKDGEK